MRLLHTSDWHFGKILDHVNLLEDQVAFGEWLIETVVTEKIDVIVIAGDIYQTERPAKEAVAAFWNIVYKLWSLKIKVVGISGNHDNASVLCATDTILRGQGIAICGDITKITEPFIFTDDHGKIEIYLIPFLSPLMSRAILNLADDVKATQTAVVSAAMCEINRVKHAGRTVVVAHTWVGDSEKSESVQEIVGGVESVPRSVFDGIDYVALGHIHKPKAWDEGRICYSGTPMPYAYSEENEKSVRIVEFGATGIVSNYTVKIPIRRKVVKLSDQFENIINNKSFDQYKDDLVSVELLDTRRVPDARRRLQEKFQYVNVPSYPNEERISVTHAARGSTPDARLRAFLEQRLSDLEKLEIGRYFEIAHGQLAEAQKEVGSA